MSQDISIEEVSPKQIVGLRTTTRMDRIGEDIGTGFGKVMHAIAGAGETPTGPPLVVYHDMADANGDMVIETCIPVGNDVPEQGDVRTRALDGGTVASTVHHGPYDQLRAAYEKVTSWISEHGHQIVGPPREFYLNDPDEVTPDELLTRIEFPILVHSG
ncbi:MAG: GyrI-like domain-containing protein [Acidimicrobiia bacterium]|nr:GyrI-like domain-containing protein [Acidimicrobiia bacterium]